MARWNKNRSDHLFIKEQYQYKNQQDEILGKALPGCERNSISKTTTIGHFIKVSRIEREKSEENDHYHQTPHREFWQISNEQHNSQYQLENTN